MGYSIFLLLFSIVLLLIMISKLRIHAFFSLLIVSIIIGIMAGMPLPEVSSSIAAGFGGTMQNIGIVIVCGVVIGKILENTGGAHRIANTVLKIVGKKRAPLATAITGGIVSIPTFCDSGFVILNPVIKAISNSGNIPYMVLVTALMSGLLTTHSLVPPTPGPVAAAGILGADLGTVMVYGLIISVPVILGTLLWCNSKYLRNKYPEVAEVEEGGAENKVLKTEEMPKTFVSFLPIVAPIVLIILRSFLTMSSGEESSTFIDIINFIGTPYIALLIGCILALFLPKVVNAEVTESWIADSLMESAEIVLITGIAGSFGKILQQTGIGNDLAEALVGLSLPSVILPFVISAIVLIAQGSATVAITTTAAIVLPLLSQLGISPELAATAIGCGSFCGVLPSGSYFWAVSKLAGYDIKKGYVAVTATTFIMGAIGLVSLIIFSQFVS